MKVCPYCATEALFGSIYCEQCGEALFQSSPPEIFLVIGSQTITPNPSLSILLGRNPTPVSGSQVISLENYSQEEMGVSRNHAIIFLSDSKFFIKDTSSTNGTWLNMNKIKPQEAVEIHDNDRIRLANFEILVNIRKR